MLSKPRTGWHRVSTRGAIQFFYDQTRADMTSQSDLLTVAEFAQRARLKVRTVYKNIDQIPHIRIGSTVRIPASALEPTMPAERSTEAARN